MGIQEDIASTGRLTPAMNIESLTIRRLIPRDVAQVASVHMRAFPKFFLTFLGERFLRLYYASIVDFDQIGFVALDDKRVVGFVVGIDNGFGFYRQLLRRKGVLFAIEAGLASLRQPRIVPRLVRALLKRSPPESDQVPSATLTSIAVLAEHRVPGIGRMLEEAFVAETRVRGLKRVRLETDAVDNARVLSFYQNAGYQVRRSYSTTEGRRMHELAKDV